jgi:hypothetical protein
MKNLLIAIAIAGAPANPTPAPALASDHYVAKSTAASCAKAVGSLSMEAESEHARQVLGSDQIVVTSGCNQNDDGSYTVIYTFERK